ncbi:putative phosphoenolpyruvate synthase, partial [Pseudolycoriella hygida]
MQSVALFTCAIVGYVLVFQKSGHKKVGHYSLPGWTTFIKKYWAERQLRIKQNNYQFNELADFNYLKCENIKIAEDQRNSDTHLLYGSDQQGNSLLVKFTKRLEGNTEIWLVLRLKNGNVYTLPEHPNTQSVSPSSLFEAEGLRIEHLIPFKSLRITFNGILRSSVRRTSLGDYNNDQLRFVKFNFIWSAANPPHHYPNDWSLNLRSTALATEPWRSGDWMNYLATPDFGGYDQFGSLLGQVFIDDRNLSLRTEFSVMQTYELNLPGIRQRRCLPFYSENQRRYAYIYGVCHDGSVFVIGASSYEDSMTHLTFGYIRTAKGKAYSISWTNFRLMNLAEDPALIAPKALSFQFKADRKIYSAVVHFSRTNYIPLDGQKPAPWIANILPVEIGLNGQQGFGTAILWYADPSVSRPMVKDNSPKHLITPKEIRPDNRMTLMFDEKEARSVLIAGGKGASLALLSSIKDTNEKGNDFVVPKGFIVSVSAYNLQVGRNSSLGKLVRSIRDVAYGNTDGNLQDACDRTIAEFQAIALEDEIITAVTKSYEQIVLNSKTPLRLAVRSSAIGEDAEDASSAGQNETFLGLRNLQEVLESIRKCWASLFTYQSVEYRRQHIQAIDTQMAVVVQVMVPSDCAGVLFTRHPASGDPSQIFITANYGLGETVVSGAVDPDTYIVYRKYKENCLSILEKSIGSKNHFLQMSTSAQGNNVEEQVISKADQDKPCLSDETILKLAKIGTFVEKFYGNARDIEWAVHKDEIFLLQSRPITTLNSYTNWELLHELDTAIMSEDEFSTFANVGEVFPEMLSPLSLTTVATVLNKITSILALKEKDFYDGLFSNGFVAANHRVTMDVLKVFMVVVHEKVTIQDKMQAISVCGHEYVTPEIHRIAKHRNGLATTKQNLQQIMEIVQAIWQNKEQMKIVELFSTSSKDRYSKHNLLEFKDYTASQFFNLIEFEIDDNDRLGLIFITHAKITMVSVFFQLISMLFLAEGATELTAEHYADIAIMLGHIPVESAEVPRMLKEIADDIYLHGKSDEFETVTPTAGMQWLELNCISAFRLTKEFLRKHGHRSLKEFDLATKTWEMRPEQIIEMLQATSRSAKALLKDKKEKADLTVEQIVKMLKMPKKKFTRKILSYLIPLCKSSVQNRETSKSVLIAYIHELRKAFKHLASLMVSEGLLPDEELIFYLTRSELSDLLKTSTTNKYGIVNKAMRRLKLFPLWSVHRFEEVNKGLIRPVNDSESANYDGLKMVTGTPVCEGVITARACVLNDFSEVHKIEAGDILVTHSTDIGWSPYFPILGGVVTELGGLISHGAVVAREYGLPCVVGAVGATSIFKFGDRVTLDARKGFIAKVEEMESNGDGKV